MVHNLEVLQSVLVDVFRLEGPLQIEAIRLLIFVLDPASLLQSFLYVSVATLDNEDLGALVDAVFLAPGCHISDVQEDLVLRDVPLNEILESLVVVLDLDFLLLRGRAAILMLFFLFLFLGLFLAGGWRILNFFKLLQHFFASNFLYFSIPSDFVIFLLLFRVLIIFNLLHQLFLPLADLFSAGFFLSGNPELLLLLYLIVYFLRGLDRGEHHRGNSRYLGC